MTYFTLTLSGFRVYSIENLDVLPIQGRVELFHSYLMNEVNLLHQIRIAEMDEALTTIESLKIKQKQLYNNYVSLLGDLPEKTPLNPIVTDSFIIADYKIEKLCFESVPNHHVTANLYIPVNDTGPFPTVLVTCGHYSAAKAIEWYQDLCILLVKNGFAALVVDPIAQGERYQVLNSDGKFAFENGSGTGEHSHIDVGAVLTGTSVVAYELWDNHRAIDYLYSRTDVVDTSRVGCIGHSGGGVQASYLLAFDKRLKVGAVANAIMNEPTLYGTIGPQAAGQNLSYEGAFGIDHPEYITMFAPKPFLILATTVDFFDINATRETYTEVQKVYAKFGVPDNVNLYVSKDAHDLTMPKRQAAVKWFRTWFYNDSSNITEGVQAVLSEAKLQVTKAGNVLHEFENEKSVIDLNIERAQSFANNRVKFWADNSKDSCLNKVRDLIKLEKYETPMAENVGVIERATYTIDKIVISSGNDVPIPGLLFKPGNKPGKLPAVLYLDGRVAKKTDAKKGGIIEKIHVNSGKIVFAVDVRGFGETKDDSEKNQEKHGNIEHRNAVISLYAGKTFIGQRVADVMKALDVLLARDDVDADSITIIGIDRAGTVALHAAALDERITEVILYTNTQKSWIDIVENPTQQNNMTHIVPSGLKFYDLPDLVNSIAPRTVTYTKEPQLPVDTHSGFNIKSNTTNYLIHNYPNPFNEYTNIEYVLLKPDQISLRIFNSIGEEIKFYCKEHKTPGIYSIQLDATNFNPDVYYYQIITSTFTESKKMMVIR